jgi:hypothetical protein
MSKAKVNAKLKKNDCSLLLPKVKTLVSTRVFGNKKKNNIKIPKGVDWIAKFSQRPTSDKNGNSG